MPLYSCPRCGYKCNQRNDLRKHFKRKKICDHNFKDISISECFLVALGEKIEHTLDKTKNAPHMHPKLRKNDKKCIPNESFLHPNKNSSGSEIKCNSIITCEYCAKTFTHHQNYYRHKKYNCKKKDQYTRKELEIMIESRDNTIKELSSQIEKLLDKIGTTNNTTNNTFNFVVNAFGKEDISYIHSSFIQGLIQNGPYNSIPKLLKEIHFHPEHSENLNVKIPNKKLQVAQIFNGVNWVYKDKRETIENMSDKAYGILNEHYDKGQDNKYMEKFKNDYEERDKETIKRIKDTTELTILNNQD
tara:strand:- start:3917 stop:4822 length:906 start_codon:yes stop_codon:yes gene_type:complete